MTRPVTRLDIDRIHIKVLILILAEQLGMTRLSASPSNTRHRGLAGIAVVAVCREELGEDAADDWAQERQTGADDCYVALCSGPVGCTNVAVC